MPPKFKRNLERNDLLESKDVEIVNLLDNEEDGEHIEEEDGGATAKRGSNNKVRRVQGQVQDVIGIMKNNIDKVMDRGDRLEDLEDRSESLASNADYFNSRSKKLRRDMWWKEFPIIVKQVQAHHKD